MATKITELFGFAPSDNSEKAKEYRANQQCPFTGRGCDKKLSDGLVSGVCTLSTAKGEEVICCPNRLYAEEHKILKDIAEIAFGSDLELVVGTKARAHTATTGLARVAVFGKHSGGELRLPKRGKTGGYFVDWILAKLTQSSDVESFVALEVQSIDTTGNYREAREAFLSGNLTYDEGSTAGFNWENVSKRILPQLIYKGHVLRRESACSKGLFFVCPKQVYEKIKERLGNNLMDYTLQTGALTFVWYELGAAGAEGECRPLKQVGKFTTTVDQVANAFTSPVNLPEANVYLSAIRAAL